MGADGPEGGPVGGGPEGARAAAAAAQRQLKPGLGLVSTMEHSQCAVPPASQTGLSACQK